MLGLARFNQAVRIQRGVEATLRRPHIAQHEPQDVPRCVGEKWIVGNLVGLGIRDGELGLVVEHLLKMRHMPNSVGRITMESAADVVVDAAARHLAQRLQRHLQRVFLAGACVIAQKEIEHDRSRELWRGAEASAGLCASDYEYHFCRGADCECARGHCDPSARRRLGRDQVAVLARDLAGRDGRRLKTFPSSER